MAGITVTNTAGVTKQIIDIAQYEADRAGVIRRLEQLYAGYEGQLEDALVIHEAAICALVNRYHELTEWIDRFEQQATARANIEAGWALLKQIRAEQPPGDQS